jgi:hypothetical protein
MKKESGDRSQETGEEKRSGEWLVESGLTIGHKFINSVMEFILHKKIKNIYIIWNLFCLKNVILYKRTMEEIMSKINKSEWVFDNFNNIEINDFRLQQRTLNIANSLSSFDGKRMTEYFTDEAELKAAYRFMSNKKTGFEKVSMGHWKETERKCLNYKRILAIQDTTEANYTNLKKTKGLSYINSEKSFGLLIHSVLALDAEFGTPIGLLHGQFIDRDINDIGKKKMVYRRNVKYEEKESYRWKESIIKVKELFEKLSPGGVLPEITFVADRECDIYEILAYCSETKGISCLIRSSYNRSTISEYGNLYAEMDNFKVAGETEVHYIDKNTKKKITTKVNVSFGKVTLKVSNSNRYSSGNKNLKPLEITAILVKEANPKSENECLCWRLFTTYKVTTFEDALSEIENYERRWRIEEYHKCLKTGFSIESAQFDNGDDIKTLLGFCSVLAFLLLLLTHENRINPDKKANELIDNDMISVLEQLEKKKFKKYKHKLPKRYTLGWAVTIIALLGGYKMYNKKPGSIVLWRGLRKLKDLTEGYKLKR